MTLRPTQIFQIPVLSNAHVLAFGGLEDAKPPEILLL
jgi:hypothetical protein